MIVELIHCRYTAHAAVLYDYLEAKFGTDKFQVIVSLLLFGLFLI